MKSVSTKPPCDRRREKEKEKEKEKENVEK